MKKTKPVHLNLECILSDADRLKYSKELAENISKRQRLEDSFDSYKAQQKSEIAVIDANINNFSEKINTGREYRDVECTLTMDYKRKVKVYTRTDTGEVGREVDMTEADLQEKLDLEKEEE